MRSILQVVTNDERPEGVSMRTDQTERGGKTALLVIDVQNAVMAESFGADEVVGRIATVIADARTADVPVVYIQHEIPETPFMAAGTDGWQIRSEIAPQPGDPVIAKRYGDAFVDTTLEEALAGLGTGHLMATGAQSDACVHKTTTRALLEGYDVTLVADAHTTCDGEYEGVVIPAAQIVAHVNYATPWIDYPGTTSRVVSHSEAFAPVAATA